MSTIAARPADPTAEREYPAPPWELHGQAHGHAYLVRAERLPPTPDGFDPLVVAGRGLAVAAWVDYREPSPLTYGELLAGVVGRHRGDLLFSVTHMWVDSAASRAGGRELWGYPKELADLDLRVDPTGGAAAVGPNGRLATGTFRGRSVLPGRMSMRSATVQPLRGETLRVHAVMRGGPMLGTGRFTPDPAGELGWLEGARRLASFGLRDFHFSFGV